VTISSPLADENRLSIPVAFSRGLNTIGPGNVVNQAILPQKITVDQGGVVHFLVAGSHVVTVYNPGTKPEDIIVPPPPPPFTYAAINDATNRFYLGIIPPAPRASRSAIRRQSIPLTLEIELSRCRSRNRGRIS
jgi:hypothetical protein